MPQRAQDAAACPDAAASDIEARSAAAASNCVLQSAEAAAALGMTECSDTMQQRKEDPTVQANITVCAEWLDKYTADWQRERHPRNSFHRVCSSADSDLQP